MDTGLPTDNFDLPVDHGQGDAEAALAALRAAIGQSDDHQFTGVIDPSLESAAPQHSQAQPGLTPGQQVALEKGLSALNQLSLSNQTILDNLNIPQMLSGLAAGLDLILKSGKRQQEILKNLQGQLLNSNGVSSADSSTLSVTHVPRADFDELKTRYDALVANQSQGARKSRARQSTTLASVKDSSATLGGLEDDRSRQDSEERGGLRKRRSIKLEHLVHQQANRRLGVEYNVSKFETKGSKDLPDPELPPPSIEESVNEIEEYRPDFKGDINAPSVKPYLDRVTEDCWEIWESGLKEGEPTISQKKIQEAVHVYWTRLSKRWEEQLARDRGEVHKDELVRRKQNQYRRQQSLLARRIAAFNQSPLGVCKLRALYRTLLTIDFVPPTNERPDPKRAYTEDEWYAYQKHANGGRAPEAHEVVDQFWFSPSVRSLLATLDVFATDQSARMKRKGRPKQPAPTFNLPPDLWDRSSLPPLRQKDANGLPVQGTSGIVLFKFHVDEKVQAEYPEWAKGLYDNPPIPDEDVLLPGLTDVMQAGAYSHLVPRIKALRSATTVARLTPEQITEINNRPRVESTADPADIETDAALDLGTLDMMSRSIESLFSLSSNPFAVPTPANPLFGLSGFTPVGPSAGSSVNARKQSKRLASEVPGGAATPVAKRKREDLSAAALEEEAKEVGSDLQGDGAFLEEL